MKNIKNMLKQAQQMQAKMADVQAKLEQEEVDGSAGGGMVTVKVNGKGQLKSVKIDPSLSDDLEMVEDLVVAAFNDAKTKADALMEEKMSSITAGLPMGDMKFPF